MASSSKRRPSHCTVFSLFLLTLLWSAWWSSRSSSHCSVIPSNSSNSIWPLKADNLSSTSSAKLPEIPESPEAPVDLNLTTTATEATLNSPPLASLTEEKSATLVTGNQTDHLIEGKSTSANQTTAASFLLLACTPVHQADASGVANSPPATTPPQPKIFAYSFYFLPTMIALSLAVFVAAIILAVVYGLVFICRLCCDCCRPSPSRSSPSSRPPFDRHWRVAAWQLPMRARVSKEFYYQHRNAYLRYMRSLRRWAAAQRKGGGLGRGQAYPLAAFVSRPLAVPLHPQDEEFVVWLNGVIPSLASSFMRSVKTFDMVQELEASGGEGGRANPAFESDPFSMPVLDESGETGESEEPPKYQATSNPTEFFSQFPERARFQLLLTVIPEEENEGGVEGEGVREETLEEINARISEMISASSSAHHHSENQPPVSADGADHDHSRSSSPPPAYYSPEIMTTQV